MSWCLLKVILFSCAHTRVSVTKQYNLLLAALYCSWEGNCRQTLTNSQLQYKTTQSIWQLNAHITVRSFSCIMKYTCTQCNKILPWHQLHPTHKKTQLQNCTVVTLKRLKYQQLKSVLHLLVICHILISVTTWFIQNVTDCHIKNSRTVVHWICTNSSPW